MNKGLWNDFTKNLEKSRIIVIIRGIQGDRLIRFVQILKEEGYPAFEFALDQCSEKTVWESIHHIEMLKKHFGTDISLGAGTVMKQEQVKMVSEAGGQFIISPDVNPQVIRETKETGLISMPGAFTPTEIAKAYECGADIVKIFPAGFLGSGYIKAVRAPFHHIPMAAVGGICPENAGEFLNAGVFCLGVGNDLMNAGLLKVSKEEACIRLREKAKVYRNKIEDWKEKATR